MKSTWPRKVSDAVRVVAKALTPATPPPPRSRDPWYSDLERRRAVNARARRASSWLGDTSNWWQRGGRRGVDS